MSRHPTATRRAIEVLRTGPLALVQDLGRFGHAVSGVSPSGAADRHAYRLGALLVGQPADRAAIEVTMGGLAVTAGAELTVALTGAPGPAWLDGDRVGYGAPLHVPAGAELTLDRPDHGLRSYLSVRGGIDVPQTLGSRSTDTIALLGPSPLQPGDVLPIGEPPADTFPRIDQLPPPGPPDEPVVLDALPGPRLDVLADPAAVSTRVWTVSGQSDRVGLRLTGDPIRLPDPTAGTLPSEGLVRGAVQLPPGGEPVIFLADHPVTGGYPVIAVLTERACDEAAQLVPGQQTRLRLSA